MASREWIESAARTDKDPVGAGGFGSRGQQLVLAELCPDVLHEGALTFTDRATQAYDCQLSVERKVKVCLIKGHVRDAQMAREWLQALGLIPGPPRRLKAAQTTSVSHKARGT